MKKFALYTLLPQISHLILVVSILVLSHNSFAQYCVPITKCSNCGGFGITQVVFNTINNTSADADAGYQNFTSVQTTVIVGQSYDLIMNSNAPAAQNFRAWVDWNDDKIFDNVNELATSCNQILNCTTSVTIPVNALFNTPLRMRVASDYYIQSAPAPCDSLEYGQAEDYTITVQQNNSLPNANFSVDNTTTCNGNVQFTDNSANIPTQWFWNFGDSVTSTLQNPLHTYSSSGTYTVTLIAFNSFGSDTLVKNNYITVNPAQQLLPISCAPSTIDTSINYGIYKVTFNTINNITQGNTEGYQDYSCTKNTTVTEGISYTVSITTGSINPEDVYVWLDFNGDGELNNTSEKIFTSLNSKIHLGTTTIPTGITFGVPLRMRITSDATGNSITPCTNPLFGQVEDYGVTILPLTSPPFADFTSDHTNNCNATVTFTDLSVGFPNSWHWNFGDGTTSQLQNPSHIYTSEGTYTITLVAANQFGADTIVKTNYIKYNFGPMATSCNSLTYDYCCGMGIYNVQFNTIDKSSDGGADGYQDYSCEMQTSLNAAQNYNISVTTGTGNSEKVRVWIDWNNNGILSNSNELAFSSNSQGTFHTGNIFIPNSAVKNTTLRMRVSSNFSQGQTPLPCQDIMYGQAEDYAVIILPPVTVAEESAQITVRVFPNPSDGKFTLTMENGKWKIDEETSLQIYNILGEIVLQYSVRQQVSVTLNPGIYFLKSSDGENNYMQKIIIE